MDLREVTPTQVGFVGARTVARLRTRTRRGRKWQRQIVYLLSSLSPSELTAQGVLKMKRNYWVIESRLHHCLDISLREDFSRVRDPNSTRVLGAVRRIVVSCSNAAVDAHRRHQPKTKANTKSFQKQFTNARGGPRRLHALLFAKNPILFDL